MVRTCRVAFGHTRAGNVSIEMSNFVTKGCLSNRKTCLGSAQNLRSGRFNLEFRCHPPIQGRPPSFRPDRPAFLPRVDIFHASKTTRYTSGSSRKQPSASHGCGRSLNCHTIRTIWNGAYPEEAPVQPPIDLTFNIELPRVGDDDDAGGG